MLENSLTTIILCYSKEVRVNFNIEVKVVSVSTQTKYYLPKDEHVEFRVQIVNCEELNL